MAFATIKNGRINRIIISPEEAAKRGDIVTVPDSAQTGQLGVDGKPVAPPNQPTKSKLSEDEMVALYTLARTDDRAA